MVHEIIARWERSEARVSLFLQGAGVLFLAGGSHRESVGMSDIFHDRVTRCLPMF
jgi:hypothetical protein